MHCQEQKCLLYYKVFHQMSYIYPEIATALTIVTQNYNLNKSKKKMSRIKVKPFLERRNSLLYNEIIHKTML